MSILKVDELQSRTSGNRITLPDVNNYPPYRNLIINGDMSIAQRGTSTSSVTTSGYYACDRWDTNFSSLGTWTISQDTDVPSGQGFGYSMKWDCTTADASPSAGDNCIIQQHIEGQMLQQLKKGTSNAESVTMSFWVKSNKTGTYTVQLRDIDNSRHICKEFTISSSATWEKKTLTFAGDTTGAFDNDNAKSLQLDIYLGAGSNFTSGTLASSWASYTQANTCPNNVNLADSASNYINLTGVQLEVGDSATPFEFLPIDVNLQRCARYFQQIGNTDYTDTPPGGGRLAIGLRDGSTSAYFYPKVPLMAPIRARPSISFNNVNVRQDGTNINLSSTDTIRNYGSFIGFNALAASNLTVSNAAELRFNGSDAYMRIDAEL